MQNMDPFDSKNKILFKKRVHRPWKPALMENTLEEASEEADFLASVKTSDTERLEHTLEHKQLELNDLYQKNTEREENRLLIGGFIYPRNIFFLSEEEKKQKTNFLMNDLQAKEQEILSIGHDLKISKALKQAEEAEYARKKEEEARLASEEKALHAIQQAKETAEQVYKIERALCTEKQLRQDEEKLRNHQEDKIRGILREVGKKEQKISEEMESKRVAEEKAKYALEYAKIAEQKSSQVAADRIQAAEQLAYEKIKEVERQLEKKTREVNERLQHAQMQSDKKIQKAQEQIRFNEKARITAQSEMQRAFELLKRSESINRALEDKLNTTQKEFERKLEETLKQDLNNQLEAEKRASELSLQLTILKNERNEILNSKIILEEKLQSLMHHLKKVDILISTEKHLRKILEEKNSKQVKLTREIESQKALAETKLAEMIKRTKETHPWIDPELGYDKTMELKVKELTDKTFEMERSKQEEIYQKQLEIEALHNEKMVKACQLAQALEMRMQLQTEKTNLENKLLNTMQTLSKKSETYVQLQNEKLTLENQLSDTLKNLHEKCENEQNLMATLNARVNEFEKAIESLKNDASSTQEALEQKERVLHKTIEERNELEALFLETRQRMQELEFLLESEKDLRNEAEEAKKSAEEKIARAIEQASKTVLNVLSGDILQK